MNGADLPVARFHRAVVNDSVNAKDVVGRGSLPVGSMINARTGSLDFTQDAITVVNKF